jgi:coenzyme F420-reducing hydrogenase beta subunit
VRQAEADLHDANETLADTVVGSIVTKESVQAALVQNLHVESELHDAVKELQVVTDLLKVAEQQIAVQAGEDVTMAGRRSGEGVRSVLAQMRASAQRKDHNS